MTASSRMTTEFLTTSLLFQWVSNSARVAGWPRPTELNMRNSSTTRSVIATMPKRPRVGWGPAPWGFLLGSWLLLPPGGPPDRDRSSRPEEAGRRRSPLSRVAAEVRDSSDLFPPL